MTKMLVPDTDVFAHFQHFDTLPWKEIANEDGLIVVVLAAVLRELDKLKLEPRLRDRVRDVLPRIEDLFTSSDVGTLADGTRARFEHERGDPDLMARHGLELRLGDDRILAAILALREQGENTLVVRDDTAVRLRAPGFGLSVLQVPDTYRRPAADPLQAENAKLRRELNDLRTAMPRLDVGLAEGGQVLRLQRRRPPPKGQHGRVGDFLRLRRLSLDSLPAVYEYGLEKPNQSQVDAYNRKLEAFRPTYDDYVAKREEYETFPHRSFALELLVRNAGGRPADAVQLTLELPDDVTFVREDDIPTEPDEPVGPTLPGQPLGMAAIIDTAERLAGLHQFALPVTTLADFAVTQIGIPGNVSDPEFERGFLRFGIRVLSNFDEVLLPRCVLCFPNPGSVRSIRVPYKLRSHSLPQLLSGDLHVTVESPEDSESDV